MEPEAWGFICRLPTQGHLPFLPPLVCVKQACPPNPSCTSWVPPASVSRPAPSFYPLSPPCRPHFALTPQPAQRTPQPHLKPPYPGSRHPPLPPSLVPRALSFLPSLIATHHPDQIDLREVTSRNLREGGQGEDNGGYFLFYRKEIVQETLG